jgi:autotransporter-associated beta strand protein
VFTADLGHAGPLSGSVTLDFHSAPIAPGLTGRDTTDSVSVTTAGGIYSGQAEWNRLPGGDWNTDTNWRDTQSSLQAGTPGLPGFSADTALFGRVIGNVPTKVTLAGFSPTVSALTFDNFEAGYTIDQGSGGTLVLGGGSGASIAVLSGAHTIAAPLELADDLTVSGPEVLIISGQIQGVDKSLTKSDGGLLLLSNAQNTYSGGTIVTGGLVLVTNAGALPAGGSLTIGAGAAVELDIGITGTPPVARARSVAAVPEPGTLALVVAAVIAVAALSSRRLLH